MGSALRTRTASANAVSGPGAFQPVSGAGAPTEGARRGQFSRPRGSVKASVLRLLLFLVVPLVAGPAQAQYYAWANFAGEPGVPGTADGRGNAARFRNPVGVAVDDVGNVYVADSGNYTIRKVSAGGLVTTLAGSAGSPGAADGNGTAAQFRWPTGVVADNAGGVYVADTDLHTIRQVSAVGAVTTLAGNTGNIGSASGSGSAARFNNPHGVARDSAGVIYVADTYNRTIREVTAGGEVTTLAGLAGNIGSADGTSGAARFYDPLGVAVNRAGTVYVADSYNHTLRQISAAGVVTTLAGAAGTTGSADGLSGAARFSLPFGVAVDDDGSIYVTDSRNYTVRRVSSVGQVTTIGGTAGSSGVADGNGTAARFGSPYGIAVDRAGIIYVADAANHRISRGTPVFPATVTGVTSPQGDGIWGIGGQIAIVVTFSKPVTVTGIPRLTLETGVTDGLAIYTGGSGTTMLTFLYTVATGHTTPDLDCAGISALTLGTGIIRDADGILATLALPAPGTASSLGANEAIEVDGMVPTVTLTSTATEPTNLTPIPVVATFSRAVTGFGLDDLVVTHGTAGALTGSGATYTFTVTPSDQGLVTATVAAAACVSLAGNPNSAATPLSRTYDSLGPTVTDVRSPTPNGVYGPGAVISIQLTFAEPVLVVGAPQLVLETGATDALASYIGGSGTTTLACSYTVLTGQISADLDYRGTDALVLHDSDIQDAAGNRAVWTLPSPGAPHSLGANQALVVASAGAPNGPFLARLEAAEVALGRGLWNLSGTYATRVGGNDLVLDLVHDTRGRLTGTASLQLNHAKALVPLALSAKGSVRGSAGALLASFRLKGAETPAAGTRAALGFDLALEVAARQLSGPASGSLELDGLSVPISEIVTLALPAPMDGTWSLRFELQQNGRGTGGSATLTLVDGVQHPLVARGRMTGSTAVLCLTGLASDPPAQALRIRTTFDTLQGAIIGLDACAGQAYGQTLLW